MNHRREHASKEETLSKTTPALCLHNVTTTNLLLALADACDVMLWIHHPIHRDGSIFILLHHQTGDFDIAMKQSRYDILKLEAALALKFVCYPKCLCVVQVIIQRHGSVVTSSNWVRCSPDCTSFAEMESRWFGCSRASAAWSRPRLGTSRSSTSPSRSPSTRCSYAYLVEFRNFYINIDNIRRRHLLNIHNMRTKKVSSQDTLCFIHTSIPDCWLCRKNLRFHLKNCLQPQRGQWSESCRCWTPRCSCRRTMRRPVSPVSPAWTWPSW